MIQETAGFSPQVYRNSRKIAESNSHRGKIHSDAADLLLPEGRFDRYYFAYDGDVSNISISGGSPGLTAGAKVTPLPAGYEIVWKITADCRIQNLKDNALQNSYEWRDAKNLIRYEKTAISQLQSLLTNSI